MSVPLLRLSDIFDSYTIGEVNIHPSAVIAPGVILQAAANSKIIIGSGVCIGMGSILQVNEGILEIEAGANLGAGFLMVGQGRVGANACIGAATTVFNCSVAPGEVVAPGSLVGDISRQVEETQQLEPSPNNSSATKIPAAKLEEKVKEETKNSSTHFSASAFVEFQHQSDEVSQPSPTPKSQSPPVEAASEVAESHQEAATEAESAEISNQESAPVQTNAEANNTFGTQIYGQGSINRLLITLFPHRESLNDKHSDNSL